MFNNKNGLIFLIFYVSCIGLFPTTSQSAIHKITNNQYNNTKPSLYNGTIAWESNADGDWEIYYWDGSITHKITDNSGIDDQDPSLYDGKIAWEANSYLWYWNGDNNQITNFGRGQSPSLHSGGVAWEYYNDIFYWDGVTTYQITDNSNRDYSPSLYNNTISWIGDYDGDYDIFYWNGNSTKKITNTYTNEYSPSLYNGSIAWGSFNGLYYWDGTTTHLITSRYVYSLTLNNGEIAWSDSGDIFYWDGTRIYQITNSGDASASIPSLHNGKIAFVSNIDGGNQIYYWDGNNDKPVADAGDDQKIKENDHCYIELDGSRSEDPDGFIESWEWALGGEIVLGEYAEMSCPNMGSHTVTLTVTDNFGHTSTDTMIVEVQPFNLKANAGSDQIVEYGTTATLLGKSNLSEIKCEDSWPYFWEIESRSNPAFHQWHQGNPFRIDELPLGVYDVTLTVENWCSYEYQSTTDTMILSIVHELPESQIKSLTSIYLLLLNSNR